MLTQAEVAGLQQAVKTELYRMDLISDLDIHPFTQFVWRSAEARLRWAGRLKMARSLHDRAEYEMVRQGRRKCATLHIGPKDYDARMEQMAKDGLVWLPIQRTKTYGGFCMPPGQMVYTNPTFEPIETIQVGQNVASGGPVVATSISEFDGELYEIKVANLPPVRLTPNHPILITYRNGYECKRIGSKQLFSSQTWVTPDKLILDPKRRPCVIVPKPKEGSRQTINLEPYIQRRRNHNLKTSVNVTRGVAWLLGWYMAEGSVYNNCPELAMAAHEEHVAKKLIRILAAHFGINARIVKTATGIKVRIGSLALGRFLKESFGNNANEKHVPECIMAADSATVRAFMAGWIQGDGWRVRGANNKSDAWFLATNSAIAARQAQMLLMKLGIVACLYQRNHKGHKNGGSSYHENDWTAWQLRWSKPSRLQKRYWSATETAYYLPIRKIRRVKYKGPVYNLETSTGAFQVPFIVHNSHKHFPTDASDPDSTVYGVLARTFKHAEAFRAASAYGPYAGKPTKHGAIGRLLGFPKCCCDFFNEVWPMGYYDPLWQAAVNTPGHERISETHIKVKGSVHAHQLLRYLGFRITSHLPCSFVCEDTVKVGKVWLEVMRDLDPLGTDALLDILRLPLKWRCYRGVAVVEAEAFIASTNSMPTENEYVIEFEAMD